MQTVSASGDALPDSWAAIDVYTLTADTTLYDAYYDVPADRSLIVNEDVNLTIDTSGTMAVSDSLTLNGTLTMDSNGRIEGSGTVTAPGYAKTADGSCQKLFGAGYGTAEAPYEIRTPEQLFAMGLSNDQNHFLLCNNIDMNSVSQVVTDSYGDTGDVDYLYGTLDGAGYNHHRQEHHQGNHSVCHKRRHSGPHL